MRVLVTGGSGFIGRHLGAALARSGAEVVNLDLVAPPLPSVYVRSLQGDVRDPGCVRAALTDCSLVVHLAAAHHDFGIAEQTFHDVNEGGTRVLCAELARAGVSRALFFSSVAVYGDAGTEPDEDTPPAPLTPYGASKLAAERVLADWSAQAAGRRALVLRPSVVFGEHHFANVYALVRQIESGRYLQVGAGGNRKSLAWVHNVVDAVLHLLARDEPVAFRVYNYADKPDLSSAEIAREIHAALGREPSRVRLPLPLALALAAPIDALSALTGRDLAVSRARIRKLAQAQTVYAAHRIRETGFVPRTDLRDALRRMVDWYVREGRGLSPRVHRPPAQPVLAPLPH